MGVIHQLTEEVISKIAAGEVIERPAYVVKELVENSLDANASNVKIEIRESGLEKIAVYDDGIGMSEEDIMMCFRPHTTSKVRDATDLNSVGTLGFRGEALSSIAAIGKVTIQSRREIDQVGTKVVIDSSQIMEVAKVGMPKGTHVIVENLFSSVPARKKFLKAPRTEYRHILDIATRFALSHSSIGIDFAKDKTQIFQFTPKQKLSERIKTLFGDTIYENLFSINQRDSHLKIHGYSSRPQITHYSTQKIHLFINNRHITDPLIINAIKEAYGNLLEPTAYPFTILYLTVPNEFIDVNVHPRKEFIKFMNANEIHDTIYQAFTQTLQNNNLTFFNISWKTKSTRSDTADLLRSAILKSEIGQIGKIKKSAGVLQLHNLFLVTETKNGIMLIDQHAAHEAIFYRRLIKEFQNLTKESFSLEKSMLIEVSLSDTQIIKQYWDVFDKMGFELEEFGDNVFKVNTVPRAFKDYDISATFSELLDELREESIPKALDKKTQILLSYLACKSAIKAGQHLKKYDIKKLINQLIEEDYLYTCPHGRPVKVEFSLSEIQRLFKRT